jgi:hypothetical protein
MRVVAPAGEIAIETVVIESGEARSDVVPRLIAEHAERPFDAAREPGLRVLLIRTGDQEFVLQFCLHNTLFDQTSLLVLLNELSACYAAFQAAAEPNLPPPAQYSEYVRRQQLRMRSGASERVSYWCEWFRDGPPPPCVWRDARPAPVQPSFQSHLTWFRLSPALSDAVRDLAKRRGVTVYLVALTAYARILARFTESSDVNHEVTFGTTYSDRDDGRFAHMIGPALQVPALRIRASGDTGAMLAQMPTVVADALTWQDRPLDEIAPLLGLDPPRGPLFRAVVSYFPETPHRSLWFPGTSVRYLEEKINPASRPDLYLVLWENDNVLAGYWMHKQDVFEVETARKMSEAFMETVSSMAEAL